jgi:heat-inducible transcriptional repressor
MARQTELSERKAAILRALVRHYIHTGEPVGSEALSQGAGLKVSSATIRNELASLEEMGYLTQPHTSAGRAPTDQAYRFYVDLLPARPRLRDWERRAIVGFFDEALADIDEILRGTTHLLSRLTRYASLALAPRSQGTTIIRAELIPMGSGTLLLVVLDGGRVEKRVVEVPAGTKDREVEALSRTLNESLVGKTLPDGVVAVGERVRAAAEPDKSLLTRVQDGLQSIEGSREVEHLFMGGVANIAAEEAFDRRETLR